MQIVSSKKRKHRISRRSKMKKITIFMFVLLIVSATSIQASLVAHWPFDDGSGDIATEIVASNNGVLVGTPTWTTGEIGGALNFDGGG